MEIDIHMQTPSKRRSPAFKEVTPTKRTRQVNYIENDDESTKTCDHSLSNTPVKTPFNLRPRKSLFSPRTPRLPQTPKGTPKTVASPKNLRSGKTPKRLSFVTSPKTRRNTPKIGLRNEIKTAVSTPRRIRENIQKRLTKQKGSDSEEDESSMEGDFSGSDSEFVPDESDNDNDESESNDDESDQSSTQSQESDEEELAASLSKMELNKNRRDDVKDADISFVAPDNFFMMNSKKKTKTSDHILTDLRNGIDEKTDDDVEISKEHKKKIANLINSYKDLHDRWLFDLLCNINIVLYGVGSKKPIFEHFQERLEGFPCIVVNGCHENLSIKMFLEKIIIELLKNKRVPSNLNTIVSLIGTQLLEKNLHLFIMIHNIDGPMLRNIKAQTLLASIVEIENVHLIASIDHINAPLMWDHSTLCKFNFKWWDVSTFLPYSEELESSPNDIDSMNQADSQMQQKTLVNIFKSLNSRAKSVFLLIIEHQLATQEANYQGFQFTALLKKCRSNLLASSDVILRDLLVELLDHKIVKTLRADGKECLIIPIKNHVLQQFLKEQN